MDLKLQEKGYLFAGRYQIQNRLGTGGMGDVYLAKDTFLEQDVVALKILHESLSADARQVKRFLREVQLTRKVTHANVVRTFEVGEAEGRLYFTMEYIEGKTLRDVLQAGLPTSKEVLDILIQAAHGLHAIHIHSIVHRDFKPGNLMFTSAGSIKIADFGVARPYSSELTNHDEVIGSVPYMAPEVWTGGDIGVGADLYSFGIVAYEMLTGVAPFDGESAPELMYKHLSVTPQRPSMLNEEIPLGLDEVVMKLLEKKSKARYQSVEELAAKLELIRTLYNPCDVQQESSLTNEELFALPEHGLRKERIPSDGLLPPLLPISSSAVRLFPEEEDQEEIQEPRSASWTRLGSVILSVFGSTAVVTIASLLLKGISVLDSTDPVARFLLGLLELAIVSVILATPLFAIGLLTRGMAGATKAMAIMSARIGMTGVLVMALEALVVVMRSTRVHFDQILSALSVGSIETLLVESTLLRLDTTPRSPTFYTLSVPPVALYFCVAILVWQSYISCLWRLFGKKKGSWIFSNATLLLCLACFVVGGPFVLSAFQRLLPVEPHVIALQSFEYHLDLKEVVWAGIGWLSILVLIVSLPEEHE